MSFEQGTVVRPTDETCELLPQFGQHQRFTVLSALAVTPTNRHPLTGEYIGPSLGGEYLLTVSGREEPISSVLVQRVH